MYGTGITAGGNAGTDNRLPPIRKPYQVIGEYLGKSAALHPNNGQRSLRACDNTPNSRPYCDNADDTPGSLQRLLVAHLVALVAAPERGTPAEASQLAAATLWSISGRLARLGEDGWGDLDGYTRAHAQDLTRRIRRILEAETHLPAGS